jgi:segregation and condensation protein B
MKLDELEAAVEAVLFAAGEMVPLSRLAAAIRQDTGTTRKIALSLSDKYGADNRGVSIIEADGAFQMCTSRACYEYVRALFNAPRKRALTQALLETLAIIAYKQPVTKAQIEEIRGVSADHAINRLMEYGLVTEKGRLDAPYKPILFGTSDEFLKYFGLINIGAMPELKTPSSVEPDYENGIEIV